MQPNINQTRINMKKQAGAELCQARVKLGYSARLGELAKLSKQVWLILTTHKLRKQLFRVSVVGKEVIIRLTQPSS